MIVLLRFDINRQTKLIKERQEELSFRFQRTEKLATLKKNKKIAEEERVKISKLLPPPDKLINFSGKINDQAKINNVEIDFSFGQENKSTENQPGSIIFSITAKAELSNLLNFINSLEKLPRFISLNSFNIVIDKEDKYKAIINGKVFSQ